MAKLHAMIGSTATTEAGVAREKLLALLEKHDCNWNDLPRILAATHSGQSGSPGTTSIASVPVHQWGEPFRTPEGAAYVDIAVNRHRETWPVRSQHFQHHLRRKIYQRTGRPASNRAIQEITKQLEADALFGDRQQDVHLRVGKHDGRLYLDLADDEWQVVEISSNGWRIVKDAPIRFRRVPGMLPLPLPQQGGAIEEFRSVLNLQDDDDFVLVIAWILAALRADGPYPVLSITSEHGTAKSELTETLRSLIDPNVAAVRALSGTERDLFVSAGDNLVMAFDNISAIPLAISDALCRLATGGAFATRKFFQNTGEVAIRAERPIIMNGITNSVARADLADRTILLDLKPIPDSRRRGRGEMRADFERMRPRILGVLLDAVACGSRNLPITTLPTLSRMADFEIWATACEPALWPSGTFGQAYAVNRRKMVDEMVEAEPVIAAIVGLIADANGTWSGTATDLLHRLEQYVDERQRKADKKWPGGPEALHHRLQRAAPHLRRDGIEIGYSRASNRNRTRLIEISASDPPETVQTVRTVRPKRAA